MSITMEMRDMIAEEAAGQLVQAALVSKEGMEIPRAPFTDACKNDENDRGETYSREMLTR